MLLRKRAHGRPGCRSPCLNVGPSAGGSVSESITTRAGSLDSRCSNNSRPPPESERSSDEPWGEPSPSRGISSRIKAASSPMTASGNGAVAAASDSDSARSASTAASPWSMVRLRTNEAGQYARKPQTQRLYRIVACMIATTVCPSLAKVTANPPGILTVGLSRNHWLPETSSAV